MIALGVAGLALTVLTGIQANAQLSLTGTSYMQNFNNIGTSLPAGWSVDTGATASFLGNNISAAFIATPAANTAWNATGGGFKNFASATPFANYAAGTVALQTSETNRALGVRQISATDYRVAFVLEIANTTGLSNFDLSFKLQSLDSATSTRVTTWAVDYATGSSPTTFTPATTTGTMTTGGNVYSNNTINVDFGTALDNKPGPVYIRVVALTPTTGTGNRASTAIDDYNLTWTGSATATNIQVVTKTPQGTGIPLATNNLKVKFDNPIAAGTGQVQLFKSGSSTAVSTFAVPSAGVSISDSTATFSGVTLENNTRYYVNMTAGSFTKTGGTLPSLAINDTTTWWFKTVDTATPPPPTPLTSLNETFAGCINSAMGVFVQYSVAGNKTWRCSSLNYHGAGDTSSVYINGGSAAGVSENNEDWLISKAPFNFSAMSAPELSLWQYRHFDGTITRTVKVSTNYIAGTNPNSATWTTLNVPAMGNTPALDTWEQITGIDLTPYKSTPFYLAFTYSCGTTGAYELTYDDIVVANKTVGIFSPNRSNLALQVLGDATASAINLGISLEKPAPLSVQIFDLTGRRVYSENIKLNSGKNVYTIANTGLQPGMYVIRVTNGADYGTIKAVVK
jgi:hypothetical protein